MPDAKTIAVILGMLGSAVASAGGATYFAGTELGSARAEAHWWHEYATGLKEELAEIKRDKR